MKTAAALRFMLVGIATSVNAQTPAPAGPGIMAWVSCLDRQTRSLVNSKETADLVAQSVVTLCTDYEAPARAETRQGVINYLISTGQEPRRAENIEDSVDDQSWRDGLVKMRSRVLAVIVQDRAKSSATEMTSR